MIFYSLFLEDYEESKFCRMVLSNLESSHKFFPKSDALKRVIQLRKGEHIVQNPFSQSGHQDTTDKEIVLSRPELIQQPEASQSRTKMFCSGNCRGWNQNLSMHRLGLIGLLAFIILCVKLMVSARPLALPLSSAYSVTHSRLSKINFHCAVKMSGQTKMAHENVPENP